MQSDIYLIEVLFAVAFVEMLILIVIILYQYVRYRHRIMIYFLPIAIIMALTYQLFPMGIGGPEWGLPFLTAELLQLVNGFFIIHIFDIVSRESTDPIKLVLMTIITTSFAAILRSC